jgi:hypothetical protein
MYLDKIDVLGQYLGDIKHIWSMFVQQMSVQVYVSTKRKRTASNIVPLPPPADCVNL